MISVARLSDSQRRHAVVTFNRRYGEMDRVLWCLSQHCRQPLIAGEHSEVVETLVWTIKSWWGVQGVVGGTKTHMAAALAEMEWTPELFDPVEEVSLSAPRFAADRVASLVALSRQLGVPRREFSLASKVLHWLLPWRVPVYDSYVRKALGIAESEDAADMYSQLTRKVFAEVRAASASDPDWIGELEPRSPLKAFDKCLWMLGGGSAGTAFEDPDPWRVVRRLGLDEC